MMAYTSMHVRSFSLQTHFLVNRWPWAESTTRSRSSFFCSLLLSFHCSLTSCDYCYTKLLIPPSPLSKVLLPHTSCHLLEGRSVSLLPDLGLTLSYALDNRRSVSPTQAGTGNVFAEWMWPPVLPPFFIRNI